MKKQIAKRSEDYSQWYQDIVETADLAEHSEVRGFMVIKPYGFSIWENIKKILDKKIKDTGHLNAYFPLLIPKSFITREAEHVKGFAKEMAIVTHYRMKQDGDDVVIDPEAELEEPLVIRPTSETIINSTFAKWITSYRDLPLLINQWANVVRWEMRTRLFLRTSEFLWQEGHTAHETNEQAEEEAKKMLTVYQDLLENYLAIPVITGRKSESEKFAGADITYTLEALMQDKKALQAGTSHNLGQNFAKAFNIMFTDQNNEQKHVWQTSWGVSTRLMGGLIMMHSDDQGLVLPPKIAPIQVIFVPIYSSDAERETVVKKITELAKNLTDEIAWRADERDYLTPGAKFNEWEKKGVPLRVEIGPKDLEAEQVILVRRDTGEKTSVKWNDFAKAIKETLAVMQQDIFKKAQDFVAQNTHEVDTWENFEAVNEKEGGFIYAYWCESEECETSIVEQTKATIRCIPFNQTNGSGKCVYCGKESNAKAVFAKAY